MKTRFIIIIVFLLSSISYTSSQIKKIDVETGYIAAKLLEYKELCILKQISEWYGYNIDDNSEYTNGRGSSIRIIPMDTDSIRVIRFQTTTNPTSIENALSDCGYTKSEKPRVDLSDIKGIRYEKVTKFSKTGKTCIIQSGSPTVLYLLRN